MNKQVVLLAAFFAAFAGLQGGSVFSKSQPASAVQQDATVSEDDVSETEIPKGYEATAELLTKLVNEKNPTAALNKLKAMVAADPKLDIVCHGLTHEIGKAAYAKYGNFKDAIVYNDYMCGSGYIHSLTTNALKEASDPAATIATICQGQDGYCYHGIGHGLMFYTENDVPKALDFCSGLDTSEHQARCSEGVFMQNFEAGQDDPLPYLFADDPLKVCRDEKRFKSACYLYGGEYLATSWKTNAHLFDLCDQAESGYRNRCITGMGAYLVAVHLDHPTQAAEYCLKAETAAKRNACIDGLVSYHLANYNSIPKTQAFCDSLKDETRATCQTSLAAREEYYQ